MRSKGHPARILWLQDGRHRMMRASGSTATYGLRFVCVCIYIYIYIYIDGCIIYIYIYIWILYIYIYIYIYIYMPYGLKCFGVLH